MNRSSGWMMFFSAGADWKEAAEQVILSGNNALTSILLGGCLRLLGFKPGLHLFQGNGRYLAQN